MLLCRIFALEEHIAGSVGLLDLLLKFIIVHLLDGFVLDCHFVGGGVKAGLDSHLLIADIWLDACVLVVDVWLDGCVLPLDSGLDARLLVGDVLLDGIITIVYIRLDACIFPLKTGLYSPIFTLWSHLYLLILLTDFTQLVALAAHRGIDSNSLLAYYLCLLHAEAAIPSTDVYALVDQPCSGELEGSITLLPATVLDRLVVALYAFTLLN